MRNFKKNILRTSDIAEGLLCGQSLNINGNAGYYEVPALVGENTGYVTVTLNSNIIPDRFQIIWDGDIVADSLFIGDALPNTTYQNNILATTSLNKFLYNGTSFDNNGTTTVSFLSSDIANSTGGVGTLRDVGSVGNQIGVVANYPSPTAKASEGNIKLTFNKTSTFPTTITIVSMGVEVDTGWRIEGIECP